MRRSLRRRSLTRNLMLVAASCGLPGAAGLLLAADLGRARWLVGLVALAGMLLLSTAGAPLVGIWTTRRLRNRLGALDTAARQLAVGADRVGVATAPVARDARALDAETGQLRAALAQSPTAVGEMSAWAQWLLPRWETLTARRRSDGALHLLHEMRRLRDALNEQARTSERIVAIGGRFVAAVEPSRQLRQSVLARAQDLWLTATTLARGLGQVPTRRRKGDLPPAVTRGMLYRRLLTTLPLFGLLALGVASGALSLWLGSWALFGRWPLFAGAGATLLMSVLVGVLLVRSLVGRLARGASDLADALERYADAASDESAMPDLARAAGSLETAARAVRRGTAMAGGALEWSLRMGQPLFEASAFDADAGRHLLEVAVSELGKLQQMLPALAESGAQMAAAADAITAQARALTEEIARCAALAGAAESAGGHMRAALTGKPVRPPGATTPREEPLPVVDATPQPTRAWWRPPVGAWAHHSMPGESPNRTTGGPARDDHGAPFDLDPLLACYRPMEPESEQIGNGPVPPTQAAGNGERERP